MADGLNLGKATLDLEADLTEFERNMASGRGAAERLEHSLHAIAAFSKVAEEALHQVGMEPGQGARSKVSAEGILSGVRGIGRESHEAARALDRVHLSEVQAAESEASGSVISHVLNRISRNADEAKRKLAEVRVLGGVPGRSGVGVGPFGSGFGRVGLLGSAVGVGALSAPAAAPAAVGLLAAIPTFAAAGAGALGTLALAFDNVGKAVGGDKKAFDGLSPAAQRFVQTLRGLHGWIGRLKQTAASSLFPGLTQGLRAALSPGTVGAITTAIGQFGRALGAAGAQWGRYFGSTEFQQILGPLMAAGARSIRVLSGAFLHLFDALGVVARAAIPLVNWINAGINRGAKLADSWLHAKAASGQLARGMNEAKTSLRLVGQLALSLLRVVGALGRALYPVSKIAVKALTDGLNALAGIINRNRGAIRTIVDTALTGFVTAIKLAAGAVRLVVDGLGRFVGHKNAVIATITAIGIAIAVVANMNPWTAAITGAIIAIGIIKKHWTGISRFFTTLGKEIENAFRYAWVQIERGALKAALAILKAFDVKVLGHHLIPGLHGLVKGMQAELDKLKTPSLSWDRAGNRTEHDRGDGFLGADAGGGTAGTQRRKHPHEQPAKTSHPSTIAALDASVFSTPPPFTKNVGTAKTKPKPPVIPAEVSHLEALASQEASKALATSGKVAQRHLAKELADLEQADKLLHDKYEASHGRARTQLFAAITSVENKIRTVRERVSKALKHDQTSRADQLALAVNQAKLAVENAKKGTHAYDQAVAAEARALRAEIRYWDKRAHNLKLSAKKRDQAVREEIADKRQLKALLKPELTGAAGANEAQFLSSFAQIVSSFAPNAFPTGQGGKTDTHLYEMKHELRRQTHLLAKAEKRGKFPASAHTIAAAGAVGG